MKYRIKQKRDFYLVQYRGWSTLWLWTTHGWGGYGESADEKFMTVDGAKRAIAELKEEEARPTAIIHEE